MNINKLWYYITKLDKKYYHLIDEVSSCFLQETIDSESFNINGRKSIGCLELLKEIENKLNKNFAMIAQNCAIEFCITNEYILEGQAWNCINHILKNHAELLTVEDKRYLKALNNSYLGIYKVTSVKVGQSVNLEDMVESSVDHFTVLDKTLSQNIKVGQIVATRLIKIEYKAKPKKYQISNTLIALPEKIAIQSVDIIKMMTEAMNNPFLMASMLNEEKFEDNDHNRLMQKKMWAKEILEQWYLYHCNYQDYHEFFDYEGNPLQPYCIEFDVITEPRKISKILNSLPDLIEDAANSWVWVDSTAYDGLNYPDIKDKIPNLVDPNKLPLYCGAIIQSEGGKASYRIFGEIRLKKDKLIINVASLQRANISKDFFTTKLGSMVGNPLLIKKDDDIFNSQELPGTVRYRGEQ